MCLVVPAAVQLHFTSFSAVQYAEHGCTQHNSPVVCHQQILVFLGSHVAALVSFQTTLFTCMREQTLMY